MMFSMIDILETRSGPMMVVILFIELKHLYFVNLNARIVKHDRIHTSTDTIVK